MLHFQILAFMAMCAVPTNLEYARRHGLILDNPAAGIARKKSETPAINVPTPEQFDRLVAAIRRSDGRASSQAKAKPEAELTELLAYSGCRLGEASALRWKHVNFPGNRLAVPGTKTESSCRVIPMSGPLRDLLLALRRENLTAHLDDKIVKHASQEVPGNGLPQTGLPTLRASWGCCTFLPLPVSSLAWTSRP